MTKLNLSWSTRSGRPPGRSARTAQARKRTTSAGPAGFSTYADWLQYAEHHDQISGGRAWRDDDESPFFDAHSIRQKLFTLARCRVEGRPREVVFSLHEALSSVLRDVTASAHYEVALAGPKRIVTDYIDEVVAAIEWLGTPTLVGSPRDERLQALEKEHRALGRTALMLSGGASLGFYHLGVLRALLQEELLPGVIAGSSTGAMVAGWACSHTDLYLLKHLQDPSELRLDGVRFADRNTIKQARSLLDQEHLYRSLSDVIGAYTFEEAEARSGRSLNISISPTQLHQRPRLLSAVTSPHVLVAKAVLASSAVPVMFPAVALAQRGEDGEEVPYSPHERWVDGSVHGDIPMRAVGRLHNVTNFIVSQVNPHVAPFVRGRHASSLAALAFSTVGLALRTHGTAWAGLFSKLVAAPTFARSSRQFADMLSQEYVGDINILPELDAGAYSRLFANPTTEDLRHYIDRGMQATWPLIARIRDQARVRQALEKSIAELRRSMRSDRSTAPRGA